MKNLLVIVAAFPAVSFAQDGGSYRCTLGELTRRVEVFHETGVTVPCEVHYYKDTESPGERQVLWRAVNQEGFCEAKAAEFVDKLRGMGWNCQASTPGEGESEPAAPDDTESLAPAKEIEIPAEEPPGS